MSISLIFIVIALICFVIDTPKYVPANLTALGLAFYMLSILVGK